MQRRELLQGAAALAVTSQLPRAAFAAETNLRQRVSLDEGWRFFRGDAPGAEAPDFLDAAWSAVNIPHDWSIAGPFSIDAPTRHSGGYLPAGVGWYRRTLEHLPAGRNVAVTFDGVYMDAEVWINGHSVGRRPNGYITVHYDLTPYLHADKPNVLAVRVDNSVQPNSRWYTGSGIYRHVWLDITPDVAVANWGITVTTTVNGSTAAVHASARVNRVGKKAGSAKAIFAVRDAHGRVVATASSPAWPLEAGEHTAQQSLSVPNAALWSVDTPTMYTLVTTISVDGKPVDRTETPFGIRTTRWDHDTGFWLNKQNIKLKGVCIHHDLGALGAAFLEPAMERRLQILKSMGCNAIRLTHNPMAPQLLDMCDRMGFLCIAEAFDEWIEPKHSISNGQHIYFAKWHEADLRDLIARDKNHPSIIMWSIGNEIPEKGKPEGVAMCKELVDTCHDADPSRPVTAGSNFIDQANKSGFSDALDVVGYNGGGGSALHYVDDHKEHPDRKFYGSEMPHTVQTRGVYVSTPGYASDYDENFRDMPIESSWRLTNTTPFIGGEFRWAGIDYLGEPDPHGAFNIPPRPGENKEAWPARSGAFGVIDTCGLPKDAFYLLRSMWTATPMLHLLPHWNWEGKEGQPIRVVAYTNCDQVELFFDDHSLGRLMMLPNGPMHLEWTVYYRPGKLRAVGYQKGIKVSEATMTTAGPAAKVELTAERKSIAADGKDLVYLHARIVDKDGNLVPNMRNRVKFEAKGAGEVIAVDNGDALAHEPFQANSIPAFSSECIAIVRSTGKTGEIHCTASSDGLASSTASVHATA